MNLLRAKKYEKLAPIIAYLYKKIEEANEERKEKKMDYECMSDAKRMERDIRKAKAEMERWMGLGSIAKAWGATNLGVKTVDLNDIEMKNKFNSKQIERDKELKDCILEKIPGDYPKANYDEEEMTEIMALVKAGAGAGLDSLTGYKIKQCWDEGCPGFRDEYTIYVENMLNGELAQIEMANVGAAVGIGLKKKNNGIRPLTVRSITSRIANKVLNVHCLKEASLAKDVDQTLGEKMALQLCIHTVRAWDIMRDIVNDRYIEFMKKIPFDQLRDEKK
eukprot:130646_1